MITEFGQIPSHWKISTISEETELVTDYVANGSFASLKENVTYFKEPKYAVIIRLTDFNNQFKGPFVYIDEPAYNFLKKSKLIGGEIIISNVGAYTGTVFRTPKLSIPQTLGPNSIMVNFKGNNEFYEYWLKSKYGQHMIKGIISGSAQPKFNKTSFRSLTIPVPPIEEQQAIAEVLSSLDDKIKLLQKQNETLEALAQTLFRQWFIEEAHDSWDEYTVGRCAEIIKTSVKPEANPDRTFEHYSLPAYDNQQNPSLDLGIDIKSNKYKVINKTILISKLNPGTSRVWLVLDEAQENSICSTEFVVVKPDSQEWLFFIYCLLKSNDTSEYLGSCASGTSGSHQRVKPIDVLNINFSFNNIESIRRFGLHVQPFFEKISMNRKSMRTLEQTRDTLLPKLMSGQVRVKLD